MSKDLGERNDVAFAHPKLAKELEGLFNDWETMLKKNPPPKVIA